MAAFTDGPASRYDFNELVQAEQGLISRRIFVEDEIYQLELAKIFAKCWLFLCHESQLPNPGDFLSTYMGEDPILVTRGKDGKIRAFLNSCRHRGMRVCRADAGNAAAFTCAYHAWTYASDGRLIGVPNHGDAYYGELDKEHWGLVPVPRLESYAGLIFGTWDANAIPLAEYIGDFAYYLDLCFNRRPGGVEFIPGTHKWQMPCNWKFAADNFVGDMYHAPFSHGSALKVRAEAEGLNGPAARLTQPPMMQVSAGSGHGMGVTLQEEAEGRQFPQRPALQQYLDEIRPEVAAHLDHDRAYKLSTVHATLFPNFSFLGGGTVRVWQPKGPEKMEIWAWVYVDRDAPQKIKDTIRRQSAYNFNPSGMFEQDDGENWNQCTASSRGYIARQYPFNYQMGLGHERAMEEYPGRRGANFAEINQRGFYRRWRELMTAD
jgi:phenylpropionate dioxygenase-like ring-hydroxylating dioxygenase large terminal subunit